MAKKFAFALLSLAASQLSHAAPTPAEALDPRAPLLHAPPQPTKTLVPVVHWGQNRRDPNQLLPSKSGKLYYVDRKHRKLHDGKQDPQTKHDFAQMKAAFSSPTVMTEDSEFISEISCGPGSLTITISDSKAYGVAKRHWTGKAITFGTYTEGCGNYGAGVRSYWKSSGDVKFSPDANGGTVRIAVTAVDLTKELESADLEWGTYEAPPSDDGGNVKRAAPACKPPIKGGDGLAAGNWCEAGFDQAVDKAIGYKTLTKASFLPQLESAARSVSQAFPMPIQNKKRDDCVISTDGCNESTTLGGPFDITLPNNTQSPWGPAFSLPNPLSSWSKRDVAHVPRAGGIDLYCVDCYIRGNVQISGSVLIQIVPDIETYTDGNFPFVHTRTIRNPGIYNMNVGTTGQVDANMAVGLKLDHFSYQFSKEKRITTIPLSPWSIPEIISIGPEVTLDIKIGIGAAGTGTVLAGAGATLGPWSANYNFDTDTATNNGFTFTPHSKFKVSGNFDFNTSVTFPVGFGIGIDLPCLRTAGLDSTLKIPSFYDAVLKDGFGAIVHGNYVSKDAATKYTACPGGLQWDLKLLNEVFFDVMNGKYTKYLSTWTSPALKQGCIGGPKNGQPMPAPDLFSWSKTPITHYHGASVLTAAKDGNLYLANKQSQYTVHGDVVNSDNSTGQFFHYYADEMSKYGVSRLRLSSLTQVPKTAEMVALKGADTGPRIPLPGFPNPPELYVAVDKSRNVFYPVVCTIQGKGNKVFLAATQVQYQLLNNPALIWSVTGGVVQGCSNLYLESPSFGNI